MVARSNACTKLTINQQRDNQPHVPTAKASRRPNDRPRANV
jgi:hypothetical protein